MITKLNIPITFEIRAVGICYAGFSENYFNLETPTDLILITSSESYDAIYNGTKDELLSSRHNVTVDSIHTILDFIEDNRAFIENSIRKLRGDKNGI